MDIVKQINILDCKSKLLHEFYEAYNSYSIGNWTLENFLAWCKHFNDYSQEKIKNIS